MTDGGPACRFARDAARRPDLFTHVCARSDGRPLRPGERCFAEEWARRRALRVPYDPPVFDGDEYQARFDRLAADGVDVHGEAALVASFGPATALDAGCGTGRVAIELARRGIEVVGVDVDASMLATARTLAPDLDWIEADLATFDLGPARRDHFDVAVLAGNVMIFVQPGTHAAVIAHVAGHVRRDGGLLVAGFQLQPGGYTLADHDANCAATGLSLVHRWSTWDRQPFDAAGADYAVSVHRRGTTATPPAT